MNISAASASYFTPRFAALVMIRAAIAPGPAMAQEPEVSNAQEAFNLGMEDYNEENYEAAIAKFQRGYEFQPETMFLYNIALAHLKLGNYADAHAFARRAHAANDLPAPAHASNAVRLGALGARLTTAQIVETERASIVARDLKERQERQALEASIKYPVAAAAGPGALTYAGAGAAIVGAGLVAGALYLGYDVQQRLDTLGTVEQRPHYDTQREEIEADQNLGQILLYSGIGLAAIGSGLLVYDLLGAASSDSPQITLEPTLGATRGARATLRW